MSEIFTDEQIDKIQAIIDSIPDNFENPEDIQCPHCGANQSLNDEGDMYTEDACIHKCGDCDKTFTIYGSISWSWNTERNSDD